MPKSSTPALFEAMVRFLVPFLRTAAIRFSGIPHRPKPPIRIVAPSRSRSIAASALATRLSIYSFLPILPCALRSNRSRPSGLQRPELQEVSCRSLLQFPKHLVEFVSSHELVLELPAGEQHAQVLDSLGHLVKGVRDVVGIGQGDVAPDLIRAAGEAQQIAQTAAREQQGQPRLVSFLARHCCQGHRDQLGQRSEEHTSELQSLAYLVCRLLLEKKKK